jgi:N4-gp56 family major capsid protein
MAGQLWGTDASGGYMYTDELSDVLRTALQPMARFRQFCDAKDATDKGLGKGEIYHWNIYGDLEGDSDGSLGELDENEVTPEDGFSITQGSLTITEYGRSVPYSGKLDNLSKHPVTEIIQKQLKNHANKVLDRAAYNQFDSTPLTVTPVSGNSATAITIETSGTPTATNDIAMNNVHVKLIVDQMKERDIPVYNGSDYFALARPSTLRDFKDDIEALHSYVDAGFNMILNGEVGRYEGVRFIEQTNIASEGWTNAKSDAVFFFGEDTVAEAIVVPEEIRGKIPTDFGRSKGIMWYYIGGFGLVHTVAAQARIIKWDSAA